MKRILKQVKRKIKRLQKELFELDKTINSKTNSVKVEAIIKIE
jgi:DNA-binding protein YbaB